MIPHFWTLVLGMPIAAVLLAMVSLGIFSVSDRLDSLGSFRQAVSMCFWFLGAIVLMVCVATILGFLLVVTMQTLHLAGII